MRKTVQQPEQVRLDVEAVGIETTKAVQVTLGGKRVWIPRSQVHSIVHQTPSHLYITPWIARRLAL